MLGRNVTLLPQVQGVMRNLTEELAQRRSLIILLPKPVDENEISEHIWRELIRRDLWVEEISVAEWEYDQDPLLALLNCLNWPGEAGETSALGGLPQVLLLSGLDQLPTPQVRSVLEAIRWWAGKSHAGELPMAAVALLVISRWTSSFPGIPGEDVRLAVFWWWGIPTALEMQILCRWANGTRPQDLVSRWRENVLPAICGNDWKLGEFLWDKVHLEGQALIAALRQYANERGWTKELLDELSLGILLNNHNDYASISSPAASQEYLPLWSEGLLQWTPEYGVEVHSAALAALGREDDIYHRVWRGQVNWILPMVDRIRLHMVNCISERLGPDWPLRWDRPPDDGEYEALTKNCFSIQWGYLYQCLSKIRQLSFFRHWVPLAREAQTIRNHLAHYRPVDFIQLRSFWQRVQNDIK